MKSESIAGISAHRTNLFSPSQHLAKKLVLQLLKKLEKGCLVLHDSDETYVFGEPQNIATIKAKIEVLDASFYTDLVFGGSVGAGEAYMSGHWSSPDLTSVIRVFALNMAILNKMEKQQSWIGKLSLKIFHWFNRNSLQGSRKNISAHYDLGNDFFSLFLDPTRMYSAAIYKDADTSLDEASVYKLKTVCDKLQLQPHDHLLEIGTGWGGLAIYAAKHYGCRVTTTTISREQREFAIKRIQEENLQDKIEVLFDDYRVLQGNYSKLVSIEMIEAVGHEHFSTYFDICSKLLKPDGLMLLQCITIPDDRYYQAKESVDFIQRYIFPGGCLPSLSILYGLIAKHTDMQSIDLQEIGEDYAQTLYHWRQAFNKRLDQVRQQGFDERFIRMWDYYLCYCEGGFRERSIGTIQLLLAKPGYRHPKWQ